MDTENEFKKLAEQLAECILGMIDGDDVAYARAKELIEIHFPELA